MRDRSGRLWESEVGGHVSSRWEAAGGRGRLSWEAEVGGHARPKWEIVGV